MERSATSDPSVEALTLAASPQQVAVARRLVRRTCRDAGTSAEMCDTAVLLTSETVTNAIIHGGTSVIVNIAADRDSVRIEVSDGNRSQPVVRRTDVGSLGGRGMGIVSVAATRWGVTDQQIGKTVWFELQLPTHLQPRSVDADAPDRV